MVPGKPVLVVWGGRGLVILKHQYWAARPLAGYEKGKTLEKLLMLK